MALFQMIFLQRNMTNFFLYSRQIPMTVSGMPPSKKMLLNQPALWNRPVNNGRVNFWKCGFFSNFDRFCSQNLSTMSTNWYSFLRTLIKNHKISWDGWKSEVATINDAGPIAEPWITIEGESAKTFKLWSFLQSKSANNVCNWFSFSGTFLRTP